MRDHLVFYVNGRLCRVKAEDAFQPLSSYLRKELGITGTKVVCEEGDCGACSTLLGRARNGKIEYEAINSCILYLYQVDSSHIITVEGLASSRDLNPVQEAMVNCHGTQCGFCTPGFIVAMCKYFDENKTASPQAIKDCLTGNLCRCTGYEPIIKAGMNVDQSKIVPFSELYPQAQMLADLERFKAEPVLLQYEKHTAFIARGLKDAVEFKSKNPDAAIISGGTDLCVIMNKRGYDPTSLLVLSCIEGMNEINASNGIVSIGARVSLSRLESFFAEKVPEFHKILWLFGSPQIRNAGTLAGNIANASPIADSPPFLMVMDAVIEACSERGSRQIKINDFYKGYKQFDLKKDEIITAVAIPIPQKDELIKLYKISRRKHLDISTNTAAFRLRLNKNKIEEIAIAFGGVAPVVLRLKKTEEFLKGKSLSPENMQEAAELALKEISPISDVRGSKEFRNQLARNIFMKLYYEIEAGSVAPCLQ